MKTQHWIHSLKIRPWLVWGLGAILALYTFLIQGAPSVMIPQLMATYGIDVVQIGVLTSSFFYTYILMQIPAGMIVDLWGPRKVTLVSFSLCFLAVGWFAFSHHFWEGQVSRMIMGFTTSPAIICAFWLGSRWFKTHLFTLIVALTEFFALAGGVIGEGGLAKAVVSFGWRQSILGVAILGLILTLLSYFIIHDHPENNSASKSSVSFKKALKKTTKNFLKVLTIPPLWINGIYGGLVFGVFPAFAALWGVPYFMTRYGISVDYAALLASTYFFGACFGTLALGWMSVYITRRRPLMIGGALIAFLLSLCVIFIPHVPLYMMFLLVFIFGFFSSTYALAFALAGTYVNHQTKGVAMGFTNMLCIAFGAPILQPLIGALLKWSSDSSITGRIKTYITDDYSLALLPIPICLLLAFFLSFFVKENVESAQSTH